MTIVKESSAQAVANAVDVVCDKPTGTVAGDVLVAFWGVRGSKTSGQMTLPADWVEAGFEGGQNPSLKVAYKVAGGSEPSTYTFSLNGSGNQGVAIARFSGVDTATPSDATASNNTGSATSPAVATSITTATNGAFVLSAYVLNISSSENSIDTPSGMTLIEESEATVNLDCHYVEQATAGSTGDKEATLESTIGVVWAAVLWAIKPAGGTAHSAVAVISGSASIIAAGTKTTNHSGAATITADANLTATPYVLVDDIILEWAEISATIAGRATLTGTGTNTVPGNATIQGQASLTAIGQVTVNATASITGRAIVIAAGQVGHEAQATIRANANLTATGSIVGQATGAATIQAGAVIIASGETGHEAQTTITANANLIATGLVTVSGSAVIVGSTTLSATATVTTSTTSHSADATIYGCAAVTVSGLVTVNAETIIRAYANLQGVPPTKGTGTREILYVPARDVLYMPAREDVIIDG